MLQKNFLRSVSLVAHCTLWIMHSCVYIVCLWNLPYYGKFLRQKYFANFANFFVFVKISFVKIKKLWWKKLGDHWQLFQVEGDSSTTCKRISIESYTVLLEERDREGPWHKPSPVRVTPTLLSRSVISCVLETSIVGVTTAPTSSGESPGSSSASSSSVKSAPTRIRSNSESGA